MALELPVLPTNAAGEPSDRDLQYRIRAEFEEMPGLKLTLRQASRLFNVDLDRCERALTQLVAARALCVSEESFVLREARERWPRFHSPSAPGMAPGGQRDRRRGR
jgi:hypothetical protein